MIIGFTGKKQSGKTTATSHLKAKYNAIQANFKDSLIEEIKKNFPELIEELQTVYHMERDELFMEKPPLVRKLLQNYGTNVRRNDNPNYWVDKWVEKVSPLTDQFIICDDVRFHNEAQAIKDLGGIIVRIEREGMESDDTHISETEMDSIIPDHTITVKTGDFDTLYNELDKLI